MNNKQELIYNWLANNPGLHTSNEIAEGVELSEFAVRVTLRGLISNNLVIMETIEIEVNEAIITTEGYTIK
jgi:predicted transcriptional regulator